MHSATCSIKLTLSDWFTAVHIKCSWSIDWLVAWFLCRAWLLYPHQIIASFLTAFIMSSRNTYTPEKVTKSGQKWSRVAKSGQEWPKVTGSEQKWPEVVKSDRKWPEFSKGLRNQSFRLEKITEEHSSVIKNAFIACGIVDKNGSHDIWHSFLSSSGFFCLKRFAVVVLVSWLTNCLKKFLNRFEPFPTG